MRPIFKTLIALFICTAFTFQSNGQIVTTSLDAGVGSLRDAIENASAGATISFDGAVTSIVLTSEITIDKNLTINGSSILNTTIDGNNATRIFNITSGNVTINNLELTGGAAVDGGAIYLGGGSLTINNSDINGNVANGGSGSGGGIFIATGASLEVNNTMITGNVANRAGGGIEDNSGAGLGLVMYNVTLSNNNAGVGPATPAPGNGGGLHITGAGDANITASTIMNNVAAAEGGGLWNGTGTMTVDSSLIMLNSASGADADMGGGGLFNAGGTLTVSNSTIEDNDALGAAGSGGGILNDMGTLTVTNTTIEGNTAVRAGGGIEENSTNASTLTLTDVTLMGNTAASSPGNGGGLHITGAGDADITGGFVLDNNAAAEGGGLWNSVGTMTVNNVTISGNIASGANADNGGGGIFNNGGSLTVQSGTMIKGNIANGTSGSGGGILSTDGTVFIDNSTLDSNAAISAGGAIEIIDGSLTFTASVMSNNDVNGTAGTAAPGNGGGLHVSGTSGVIVIAESEVSGNLAAAEGGGLWNQSGTFMTVSTTTVDANAAYGDASDNGGGGIFNNGGSMLVTTSTLSNNVTAGIDGVGAGLYNGTSGAVTIMRSTVSGNISASGGGGLYTNGDTLMLNAVTIANNTATGNGGGIMSGGNTWLTNTLVANNNASIGNDISGTVTSNNYNLVATDDLNVFAEQSNDIEGTAPNLGPLQFNSGTTMTHALEAGSEGIDDGNPADQFNDQRDNTPDGTRDIGSFERNKSVGINDPEELANISVYPNPSTGNFTLEMKELNTEATIRIVTYTGSIISEEVVNTNSPYPFDISGLPAGIYTVVIETDSDTSTRRVTLVK